MMKLGTGSLFGRAQKKPSPLTSGVFPLVLFALCGLPLAAAAKVLICMTHSCVRVSFPATESCGVGMCHQHRHTTHRRMMMEHKHDDHHMNHTAHMANHTAHMANHTATTHGSEEEEVTHPQKTHRWAVEL